MEQLLLSGYSIERDICTDNVSKLWTDRLKDGWTEKVKFRVALLSETRMSIELSS